MTSVLRSLITLLSCALAAAALAACNAEQSIPNPQARSDSVPSPRTEETPAEFVGFNSVREGPAWWAATMDGQLQHTEPNMKIGEPIAIARTDTAAGIEFRGMGDAKDFVLAITKQHCTHFSDGDFPYTATFTDGKRNVTGCARIEKRHHL